MGRHNAQELKHAFCEELRQVGALLARLPDATRPSLRTLASVARVKSPTTVQKWLTGHAFPADAEALCAVLAAIRTAASSVSLDSQAYELLEGSFWQIRHRQVLVQQQHEAEQLQRGQRAGARLGTAEALARQRALIDRPFPVRSWTAERMGVHPAISVTKEIDASFVLPHYVRRPHDDQLRGALGTAASGERAVLVVIRGGSCTGKTRAAVEALQEVSELADWQLARPHTAASALQILDAGVLDDRAVLLLDDAHQLLHGADGEALSTALLSCLDRSAGPAIVLATLWDDAYSDLTKPPPTSGLSDDRRLHIRKLLHRAQRIDVPHVFNDAALQDLAAAARSDPALAAAEITAPSGKITQTLAAGVQLLDRYESALHPPYCYARAVITAAMDATRLYWASPLPEAFLRDAAAGYLDDDQRAAANDDWFAAALATACEKIQRVAAALEPVPRRSGMGRQPGVWRLTDYLDAHGRTARDGFSPPPSFWEAAACHNPDGQELRFLAVSARELGNPTACERLLYAAFEAGDTMGLLHLALIYEVDGDAEQAAQLYRRAADHGSEIAWSELSRLREEAGDLDEAEQLAYEAAENGDWKILLHFAELRRDDPIHVARLHQAAREAAKRYASRVSERYASR